MARDGSGNYSLPQAAFVNGTTIDEVKVNSDLSDIASALTQSMSKDGQTTPTANQPLGGFKFTGLGAGTGNGESTRYEQMVERQVSLIYGWTYANNVADATNDIDIAAGGGADSVGTSWITGGAMTKRLDATFVAGTNQGGLDTGSIGNSEYYIWAIGGSAVTSDYVFSLAATIGAVTLPSGFTYARRIGWIKRAGATILAFKTYEMEGGGLELKFNAPIRDVNLANTLTTARRTDALSVPKDFSTTAMIRAMVYDGSSNNTAVICCPDETDVAPSITDTPLGVYGSISTYGAPLQMEVRTSATGTIAARGTVATVDTYIVVTLGFKWSRR